MAKEVTDSNLAEVLKSEKPVVIDFWAEWCMPCRKVSSIIEELAEENAGTAEVYKCNVDENNDVCSKYSIRNIPTILFIKGGEVMKRHVGTAKKSELQEIIDSLKA